MIVCTRCGFQNEDSDTFCGSCAGFLEWSGEKVAAAPPEPEPEPVPPPEPEAEPERAGFIDRVKDRMGIGETGSGEPGAGAGAAAVANHGPDGPGNGAPAGPRPVPVEAAAGTAAATHASAHTAAEAPGAPISSGSGGSGGAGSGGAGLAGPGPSAPATPAPAAMAATPVAGTPATTVAPIAAPPPPPAPAATSPEPATAAVGGAALAAAVTTATPRAAAAPPAAPPAAAPPPGLAGGAPAPVAAGAAPVQPGAAQPGTAQPGTAQPGAAQPGAAQPGAMQPGAMQPEAVKPAATRARPAPRAKTPTARVVNPGDLVCGQCGEGNDPSRKFCRRCGASLQRATVFVLPWYQRWWRKLTTRKTRAAGDRPRNRRRAFGGSGPGWLTSGFMKVVGIAVVLLVLLTIVGPWRGHLRHDASNDYHRIFNDVHPKYSAVHPFAATATSSARLHPPANAIDGAVNTCWMTAADNGIGQSLRIRLAAASNLDEIGFLNGDQDTSSSYLQEARPEKVHLTAVGAHSYTKDLTLKDTATFQTFTIKAKDATALIVTIDSVYPSEQGKRAAIAEVELFVKT